MVDDEVTALAKEILESHFASEFESLPKAAIDQLLEGKEVEFQRVNSASQIDLSSAVLVIKTAIDVCKFAYDVYADQRDEKIRKDKIFQNIKDNNPKLAEILSD